MFDPKPDRPWSAPAFQAGAVVLAPALTALILVATNAPPFSALVNIALGAFGTWQVFSDVLVSWIPLLLATAVLLITFGAGLWNIGIEGQIMLGGIFTTWAMRLLESTQLHPALIIALSVAAGMAGGMLWALLAGVLKAFGGVNEIFGGLGLNFVATALNLWLIFGPWKRPGIASMSGTEPFRQALWLSTVNAQSRLRPAAPAIGQDLQRPQLRDAVFDVVKRTQEDVKLPVPEIGPRGFPAAPVPVAAKTVQEREPRAAPRLARQLPQEIQGGFGLGRAQLRTGAGAKRLAAT